MFELAGDISDRLSQESVLLELQKNGKISYLDFIWSDEREWTDVNQTKKWLKMHKNRIASSVWGMK